MLSSRRALHGSRTPGITLSLYSFGQRRRWEHRDALAGRGFSGIGRVRIKILGDHNTLRERGEYIGMLVIAASSDLSYSWHRIFLNNLPIGTVAPAIPSSFIELLYRGSVTWEERVRQIRYISYLLLLFFACLSLHVLMYKASR